MPSLTSQLITILETAYGCIFLAAALAYSCLQKEFWLGRSEEEESALQRGMFIVKDVLYQSHSMLIWSQASHDLWSLTHNNGAISHNFITTANGTQMHFLAPKVAPKDADILIVFLHGFPDSSHLFSHQLRSAWSNKAQLVALDLPGCGGSDSLPSYGANEVLNVIAETINQLKSLFSRSNTRKPKCILVGHDWGGVIGFRLAAETKGLIDELVTLNSIYVRICLCSSSA